MQPYFFPYLGYFQLISAVDTFVIYDNIQYTKKGWINRNRFLQNGEPVYFTVPLKKASDYLDVCERETAADFDGKKVLNQIRMAYRKAPYFEDVYPLFEGCVLYEDRNLFRYIYHSVREIMSYLDIHTELVVSGELPEDSSLTGQDRVLDICRVCGASTYINPIGGTGLYDKETFAKHGIELKFHKMDDVIYSQFGDEFVPCLSILDVMMFNKKEDVQMLLTKYHLI